MNIDEQPNGCEVPLLGDGLTVGIVRVGDPVRRPRSPVTATVQAVLAHLHERGFTAAPVPMGWDGAGREVLSFVPGDVPREPLPDWATSIEVLVELARPVRRLHDAAESWCPPADTVWGSLPGSAAPGVVCSTPGTGGRAEARGHAARSQPAHHRSGRVDAALRR